MHFAKGHPLPETLRYFVGALADKLEISDFDPVRTETIKGAFGCCMPVPRWVRSNLGLECQMDHDTVCCGEAYMPLEEFVQIMFEWYDVHGQDEVKRRVAHEITYKMAINAVM